MKNYLLHPEAPGYLGKRTEVDYSTNPPTVLNPHLDIDTWLGDDLLQAHPCFFVTNKLAQGLRCTKLKGFEIRAVEVVPSEIFRQTHSKFDVPKLVWLKLGCSESDDFRTNFRSQLIVSEEAMEFLRRYRLAYCDIEFF